MCGIVGVVGKIFKKEEDAFQTLLQLDTVRGPHSTGVVSVTNKSWEYLKVAGTPWELFEMKGWKELMQPFHTALVGHNRWATIGDVTNDNAHPFHHGSFVGVHNGTLRSTKELITPEKFQTDSEAIYHNMSVEGVEETVKKLNGAFTLVWYNDDEEAVQIVRNSERPLYLCRSKDGYTYFFASESWMLRVALSRCGVEFNDPASVETDTLITIPCKNTSYTKEPLLAKVRKVETRVEPPKYHYVYNYKPTNVVPLRGNSRPFVQKGNGDGLRGYLGKVVRFSVHKLCAANNMHYVSCDLEEDVNEDVEVRIYVKPASKLAKRLLESKDYFTAKVKKATLKDEKGYLLVDSRTLNEVGVNEPVQGEEEDGSEYEVFNGKKVSAQGWYALTERGCAWCSDFPRIQDARNIIWFGTDQFICAHCKKEPEVMQYITNG